MPFEPAEYLFLARADAVIRNRLANGPGDDMQCRSNMIHRKRRVIAPLVIVFLCVVPLRTRAQGGPPLLTDDPGTPGNGRWEINLANAAQKSQGGRAADLPRVDINYGLGRNVQVKYEAAWTFSGGGAAATRSGLSNSLAGVKWRFLDAKQAGFDMSTYPQIEFNNPTGSLDRGLVDQGPNLFIPIEAGRTFGATAIVGEIGRWIMRGASDQWVGGLAMGRQWTDALELLAELHATTDSAFRHADPVVNVGARQLVNESFTLLASAGTGLRNSVDRTQWSFYVGLQFHIQ